MYNSRAFWRYQIYKPTIIYTCTLRTRAARDFPKDVFVEFDAWIMALGMDFQFHSVRNNAKEGRKRNVLCMAADENVPHW